MNNLVILSTQAMPEGRVFGLDSQTFIQMGVQLLNGIILAVVLTYLLYKPVKQFMEKRTNRIESEIEEAENTMAEAHELLNEYKKKMKDIDQERLEIIEAAQVQAEEEKKQVIKQARLDADEIKTNALERISADRARMEEEMRLQAIDIANLMAKQYISEQMDDEAQKQYFDQMLARMEETPWSS